MTLNPRIWIVLIMSLALLGSHWKAFKSGDKKGDARVTSAWNAEKLEQAKDLAKFSEAARTKEAEMQANTRKVINDYHTQKKLHDADAASAANSLRDITDELAIAPETCNDPATAKRANGAIGLERELLIQCAKALTNLASDADRLEAQVVGLQGYIKGVAQ